MITIESLICSAIISYLICTTICKYYLTKLNNDWIKGLDELKLFTIEQFESIKKS